MKKITIFIMILTMLCVGLSAEDKLFKKGASFFTAEFGFSSFGTPLSVSYEMAFKKLIGIGASFMYQSWGYDLGAFGDYNQTLLTPSVFAVYHLNEALKLNAPKLDLSVGGSVGFSIYSSDYSAEVLSGGIFVGLLIQARYFITDKIGISLRETFNILGDWSGSYTLLGVVFLLGK